MCLYGTVPIRTTCDQAFFNLGGGGGGGRARKCGSAPKKRTPVDCRLYTKKQTCPRKTDNTDILRKLVIQPNWQGMGTRVTRSEGCTNERHTGPLSSHGRYSGTSI